MRLAVVKIHFPATWAKSEELGKAIDKLDHCVADLLGNERAATDIIVTGDYSQDMEVFSERTYMLNRETWSCSTAIRESEVAKKSFRRRGREGCDYAHVHSNADVQHGGFHDGIDRVVMRASGDSSLRWGRVGRPAITVRFAPPARCPQWGWQPMREAALRVARFWAGWLPAHLGTIQHSLEELAASFVGMPGQRSNSQRLAEDLTMPAWGWRCGGLAAKSAINTCVSEGG